MAGCVPPTVQSIFVNGVGAQGGQNLRCYIVATWEVMMTVCNLPAGSIALATRLRVASGRAVRRRTHGG